MNGQKSQLSLGPLEADEDITQLKYNTRQPFLASDYLFLKRERENVGSLIFGAVVAVKAVHGFVGNNVQRKADGGFFKSQLSQRNSNYVFKKILSWAASGLVVETEIQHFLKQFIKFLNNDLPSQLSVDSGLEFCDQGSYCSSGFFDVLDAHFGYNFKRRPPDFFF